MNLIPQLFTVIRERLIADPTLQETLEKRVYFNLPERPTYPCVVFSIGEIIDNNDTCRINFTLQLLLTHQKGAEPLKIARAIDIALESEDFKLDAARAICRRTNMTIDLPLSPQPHAIKQFYQTMTWREPHD